MAISVVSHGHGPLLAELLDDLGRWRRDGDALVVTLNVPEANEFDKARWTGIEWRENAEPKGFGANHNSALRGRSASWYAIINPDIRIECDAIHALIERAAGQPDIALLGPAVVDGVGHAQDSARSLLTPASLIARVARRSIKRRGEGPASPSPRPDWLAGMFVVVRGAVFDALAGFDERYFLYCEDMDLSLRVQLAGFRIGYVEDIVVTHDAQRDSHRSLPHLRWHVSSLARLWLSAAFWRYLVRRPRALPVRGPAG